MSTQQSCGDISWIYTWYSIDNQHPYSVAVIIIWWVMRLEQTVPAVTMMMSSNGNIFRVTGDLCEEFTGPRWIPPHKGQWRRALVFSLICVWIHGLVNNREAGDLRRYRAHYEVTVMITVVRETSIWTGEVLPYKCCLNDLCIYNGKIDMLILAILGNIFGQAVFFGRCAYTEAFDSFTRTLYCNHIQIRVTRAIRHTHVYRSLSYLINDCHIRLLPTGFMPSLPTAFT